MTTLVETIDHLLQDIKNQRYFVLVYVGGKPYRIDAREVHSLIQYRELTPSNSRTPYHLGSIRDGGNTVHVYDLEAVLGRRSEPQDMSRAALMLIGSVSPVVAFPVSAPCITGPYTLSSHIITKKSKIPGVLDVQLVSVTIGDKPFPVLSFKQVTS